MNNCGEFVARENPLADKSNALALRIVKLYRLLKKSGETVMSKQLLRSGTSIGANVAEAQYAQSRADFVAKLTIGLKEASETRYWISLLLESGELRRSRSSESLLADCDEILKMLISSVRTSKKV